MASNLKGGGYGSRQHVEKPIKTGSGSRGIRPSWTNAPGSHYGDHTTDGDETGYRGPKREEGKSFQPVRFGNELALRASGSKAGPGADREVMRSGAQGTHGATNPGAPRPAGKDILSQFGPESKRGY